MEEEEIKYHIEASRMAGRLVDGKRRGARRSRGGVCLCAGGGGGDSPHRACMYTSAAEKLNFPRKLYLTSTSPGV
jgi:hypothetical protein